MRLNGWQRAGIVLSILWAVGAAIYAHNADVKSADNFANFAYKVCTDGKAVAHNPDLSSCDLERTQNLQTWMKGDTGNAAFTALAPIPFGWLAIFILLYIYRVQVTGFRTVVPWANFNTWRKMVVVFCVVAIVAVVVMSATVILNIYTDTQVPVALSPFLDVEQSNDKNTVTAQGTWTRSGPTEGSALADPLQTSRIECDKREGKCTEARASVASGILTADLQDYDIQSWTDAAIILRNDGPCSAEVFTIDLNTKAVTGLGQAINGDTDYCKRYGGDEKTWSYQLVSGFSIYWAQRQKARPLPLKLVQTLFGN